MPAGGNSNKSWLSTDATRLLGIEYPIIQAPFGGYPSQQLTAAVSNLGGMGSLGALTLSPSAIHEVADELRSLTTKPFAINLWVSTFDPLGSPAARTYEQKVAEFAQYYAELGIVAPSRVESSHQDFSKQVRAAIDAQVPVISFIYGVPPIEVIQECNLKNITTIAAATTADEARVLQAAGIELIVASGFEGGGHRGSFLRSPEHSLIGGLSLIPQVVDAVSVPVIAAGGIADGRGFLAAMVLGAQAVQIGTAFLLCTGSGIGGAYRAALQSEPAKETDLTRAFTGRLARGIRNRLMDELAHTDPPLPFPLQHHLIQTVARPASMQEKCEWMTIWAGQSARLHQYADAADLMSHFIAAASACGLERVCRPNTS